MARGGFGRRPSRKDYTLLRDGHEETSVFDLEAQRKSSASIRRLLGLAKEETGVLVIASVMLLVGSLSSVAVPRLSGKLIDISINYGQSGEEAKAKRQANALLVEILAILAVGGVASGLRAWLFDSAATRVMARLRMRLFSSLMAQEMGFFDRIRTGELMNRLSEDTRLMKSAGTQSISMALRSIVVAAFGLVFMFVTSFILTALTLAILPVTLLAFRTYANINKKYIQAQLTAAAEGSIVAEECFGSIRTVRAFGKEGAACDRYRDAVLKMQGWGLKSAALGGAFGGFNATFTTGPLMCVLWFGARLVVDGKLTAGELSAFVVYAIFVSGNVGALAGVFSSLIQAVGASERVFQLMDRQPTMAPGGPQKPLGAAEGGDIEFRDVWFSYPSRPAVQVLKGFSLHIASGSKVALVGPSGGGKSTVVNLVERFYDPTKGEVLLDGVPLPEIDHEHLHTQISIVSQEPVLFAESILYNICFGMPRGTEGVSREQVEEAARIANAHDFITGFPQGYDTAVGEKGVRLSGGQRQRIAIARAILSQPRVLLLDEATSALDAESEAAVQEALDRAAVGRTVLCIAHRLSTVQNSDEVVVLQNGAIAERGTHDELLAQGGVYVNLVRRQLMPGFPASLHPAEGKGSTAKLHARQEDGEEAEDADTAAGESSAEGQGEEGPALSLMRVLSS